jgi:hypothetical protein
MLNELVPKNVKAATVALGLVKKGSAEPFVIYGSGFLVDPKGLCNDGRPCFRQDQRVNGDL